MTTKVKPKSLKQQRAEKKAQKQQRIINRAKDQRKDTVVKQAPVKLSLEDHFVLEIQKLDETLSSSLNTVRGVTGFRDAIGWETNKALFPQETAEAFGIKLNELETANKSYDDRLVEIIHQADEQLVELKKAPSFDAVDDYCMIITAAAVSVLSDWNENLLPMFLEVQASIDTLDNGETK